MEAKVEARAKAKAAKAAMGEGKRGQAPADWAGSSAARRHPRGARGSSSIAGLTSADVAAGEALGAGFGGNLRPRSGLRSSRAKTAIPRSTREVTGAAASKPGRHLASVGDSERRCHALGDVLANILFGQWAERHFVAAGLAAAAAAAAATAAPVMSPPARTLTSTAGDALSTVTSAVQKTWAQLRPHSSQVSTTAPQPTVEVWGDAHGINATAVRRVLRLMCHHLACSPIGGAATLLRPWRSGRPSHAANSHSQRPDRPHKVTLPPMQDMLLHILMAVPLVRPPEGTDSTGTNVTSQREYRRKLSAFEGATDALFAHASSLSANWRPHKHGWSSPFELMANRTRGTLAHPAQKRAHFECIATLLTPGLPPPPKSPPAPPPPRHHNSRTWRRREARRRA